MIEADHKRQAVTLGLAMVFSLWVHILGLALLRYVPAQPAEPFIAPLVLEIEMPAPPEPEIKPPPDAASSPLPDPPPEPRQMLDPHELRSALGEMLDGEPAQGEDQTAALPPDEKIISLESQIPEYLSYLGQVKAAINNHWIFPPAARQQRATGNLSAVFTLDRSGELRRIVVESSSGHPILDHAALEAVRGAAPFAPFPEHIDLDHLNIRANFDYRIRYINVN
jgi:periplasmic protein TonB